MTNDHQIRRSCDRLGARALFRAERDHKNILQWTRHQGGGHYAAHLAPELLVGDVRKFFGSLQEAQERR